MEKSLKYRDRKFCMVLYPEDTTHANALDIIRNDGYRYMAIYHDKDIIDRDDVEEAEAEDTEAPEMGQLKKPHYHVVVTFSNARWNTSLADELGIAPNYIQKCSNVEAYMRYFSHMDFPAKHQYAPSLAFGNLDKQFEHAYKKAVTPEEQALGVLDLLDNCGPISFMSFVRECANNGLYAEARRMGGWLPRMVEEHNAYFTPTFDDKRGAGYYEAAMANASFHGFISGVESVKNRRSHGL